MLIPTKHNGYQAGIRIYPFGGGGGGGQPGTGDSQIGNTGGTTPVGTGVSVPPPPPFANMAVNTQQGYDTLMQAKGQPWEQSGGVYNSLLNQGFTSGQIRDSATQIFGAPSSANWNAMVQHAGMTSPTGRPMAGSDQFFQPVYQPQYQDYNMGNRMGVSQFGQGMGGFNPYAMQMQTPFNPYTNSFQPQMGMGMQTPFSSGMSQPRPQPIVSRSAQVRGTPNVMMRRAEGGIASLVDDE